MTNLALMSQNIKTLTNNHISEVDIHALINRVHQAEVESGEWHYRQKQTLFVSGAVKNEGQVSVTQGSTMLTGTGTTFALDDVGKYIRIGTGTTHVPIPIDLVRVYPEAFGFQEFTVTDAVPLAINTSVGGVQATQATITVTNGNIRYTFDGTVPTPSTGHFVLGGSEFVLTGHTNLDNFLVIAESADATITVTLERELEEINLAFAWPDVTAVDQSYELFQRYYSMPSDCEKVQQVMRTIPLDEWTEFELNCHDPNRSYHSDNARRWTRAGVDTLGNKRIELWPITTVAKLYSVSYLAGHMPLVNPGDRPLVPISVLENRAARDACHTLYAQRGDDRWLRLGAAYGRQYEAALAKLERVDTEKFGRVDQILDTDAVGFPTGFDWGYRATHDV